MKTHSVLITGSRDWPEFPSPLVRDLLDLRRAVAVMRNYALVVYFGDCPTGADEAVRTWLARTPDATGKRFIANWNRQGHAAGPRRNQRMVDAFVAAGGTDALAFRTTPDSKGTNDCIHRLRAAGIEPLIYDWAGKT